MSAGTAPAASRKPSWWAPTAADGQDRRQSRGPAHRRLRQHSRRGGSRPLAVLRRQQGRIHGVERPPRRVLAHEHAGGIKAFSETDFTDDLRRIDVPVFVAHGDDAQIVPIQAAALRSSKLLPKATLKVYPGAPHGLVGAYEEQFTKDLLTFIKN
ncbi:MAG TPA: alpha/beta hydrolase [Pseudonocardiaceae bacterium]